jgi:type I restriction enzyme S subunit
LNSQEITLADALEFVVDNRGKTVPTAEKGFPLIATNCISNDNLYPSFLNVRYVSTDTYNGWFRSHPLPDDIIITNKGSQNGAVCFVPNPVSFCIAQDMVALRAKRDLIYPKFLFAALRSQEVQNQIKNLNVDGVIPHFKKTDFNKLKLPNPYYKNQKIIGDFYFNFCEKINLNNQINQTLESIAQAIFKSWFIDFQPVRAKIVAKQEGVDPELAAMCAISGKSAAELEQMAEDDFAELQATAAFFPDEFVESELGEVPKGWEILDIDKTTSLIIDHRGKTPKKLDGDWSDSGITVLSAKHVKDGCIVNREQLRFVDTELYNKWMKDELEEGDILLTSEGPMGEMYYLAFDEKYCLSQRLYALRANTDLVSSTFLYFWLLSPFAKSDMNGRATGTTVVGIRQSELRKVKVLTPSKSICDLFHRKITANLKQIALNNNESVNLAQIRDILLPKLLSGEVDVSDLQGEVT